MERKVNVRGVVVDNDNRIFAVKHQTHDGKESEYWATPGGGLDPDESLHAGLTREFIEEVGIVPTIGRLLFVQQYVGQHSSGEKVEGLEFFFHIENYLEFKNRIDLSATSHGFELAQVAFIHPRDEDILPKFLAEISIADYINGTQPVYVIDNLNTLS